MLPGNKNSVTQGGQLKVVYLMTDVLLHTVGVQRLWRISAFTAAMVITMGTYFTALSKAS